MIGGCRAGRPVLLAGCLLATILATPRPGCPQTTPRAGPGEVAASPTRPAEAPRPKAPRGFLIYLLDGRDPIVVKRYEEVDDQIRFEKYGGTVSIPRYEVLRIVPDQPEEAVALPPAPPAPLEPEESPPVLSAPPIPPAEGGPLAVAPADTLFVTMKGGASVKATAVTAEGDRVRVTVPDGSFSVARADLVGVVRVPSGAGVPEAWITLLSGNGEARAAPEPATEPPGPRDGGPGAGGPRDGLPRGKPPAAPAWQPPYPSSDRPHLVRLASGQLLRADGFWIEDGEIKLRRLGGIVGMALGEILRLIPEELAPVHGRTAVRFSRQLGPDLLEVRVRSGLQRVRLIGVDPVTGVERADSPWPRLALGLVVYLEFDRQRYDGGGDWLAYVFLPSGRMLNAELVRLGLARPRPDARNLRYVDLFQELAEPDTAPALLPTASTK